MDWTNTNHTDEFDFVMVSPLDLEDETLGSIPNVILNKTSITQSYYSDTKYSGKISYSGDGWNRGSFIRIRHRVPEWNFTENLGTFLVTNDDGTYQKGHWVTTLNLYSPLYGMKTYLGQYNWTVGAGTSIKKMFTDTCDWSNRQYTIKPSANDYILSSPMVFPSNKSTLSRIISIADLANDIIDCDDKGYVVLDKYVNPAQRTPTFNIDMTSPSGTGEENLKRSSDFLRMPNHVVVEFTYNQDQRIGTEKQSNQVAISGSASLTVGPHSASSTGYRITDFHTVNELTPATIGRANELAAQYLAADNAGEDLEWELDTLYLPLHAGDVGTLRIPESVLGYTVDRTVMVKSNDISFDPMHCSITLKEVSSPDVESGF